MGVGHHIAVGQVYAAVVANSHFLCMGTGGTAAAVHSHVVDVGAGHGLAYHVVQREVDVAVVLVDDIAEERVAVFYLVKYESPVGVSLHGRLEGT